MFSIITGVFLLAAPQGSFVDLSTKERLGFGEEVTYVSRGRRQSLRVERPGVWPMTVRFESSPEAYVLSFDEALQAVRCLNPDGKEQLFLQEDAEHVVRRTAPTEVVLRPAPQSSARTAVLFAQEVVTVVGARGEWLEVRATSRPRPLSGWVKAEALRTRACEEGWCVEPAVPSMTGLFSLGEAALWAFGPDLYHWDGRRWTAEKLPDVGFLSSVWGRRSNQLWAAGTSGTLIRWNGARWTSVASNTEQDLTELWGASEQDVWAVGAGGTILHWDGARWTATTVEGAGDLRAVWGSGAADVWAAGAAGTLLHWDGAQWRRLVSPISSTITDLWGLGPKEVFAVSEACDLLRWNGKAWSSVDVPDDLCNAGFTSLVGTDARHIWLASADALLFWDGRDWARVDLSALAMGPVVTSVSPGEWWAVGPAASLRRSDPSPTPLLLTMHPDEVAVRAGGPATFEVRALGAAPLTYQWRRDGRPIPGATSARFTLPSTTEADTLATFDVLVSSADGAQRQSRKATLLAAGTFVAAPALSVSRAAHRATLLADGRVLITGGGNRKVAALADTDLFDPAKNALQPAAPLSTPRRYHTATRLEGGEVLIAGGQSLTATLDSAELFEPRTSTFRPLKAALDGPRSHHAATLLADGRVLVTGGRRASVPKGAPEERALASAVLYEPAKAQFVATGSMRTPRSSHSATLLRDGRVLLVGGLAGATATPSAELFEPATGTFSPTGPMSVPRIGHTATLLPDGRVLVAGGTNERDQTTASAEVFDPQRGAFTAVEPLPGPAMHHTATLLPSGRVLITGGIASPIATPAAATLFSPATGTFRRTATLVTGRWSHEATLLLDGRVLLTGGMSPDGESPTEQELFAE